MGGDGNDLFVFDTVLNATANVDRINDFTAGDHLVLDLTIFGNLGATGTLDTTLFHSGTGAPGNAGAQGVYYDLSTGNLYYDPDGAGSQVATKFATLATKPVLDHTDFLVQP